MRPQLKFAAVLALLAACDGGPLDPGPFTLEGTWLGRTFPYELSLALDQDGDNGVTGTGEIRFLRQLLETDTTSLDPLRIDTLLIDTVIADAVEVAPRGRWDYPEFVLSLRAEDFADVEYAGRYGASPDSVTGTLAGSGFSGQSIRIIRQSID
jgi:hypothetical protein